MREHLQHKLPENIMLCSNLHKVHIASKFVSTAHFQSQIFRPGSTRGVGRGQDAMERPVQGSKYVHTGSQFV